MVVFSCDSIFLKLWFMLCKSVSVKLLLQVDDDFCNDCSICSNIDIYLSNSEDVDSDDDDDTCDADACDEEEDNDDDDNFDCTTVLNNNTESSTSSF